MFDIVVDVEIDGIDDVQHFYVTPASVFGHIQSLAAAAAIAKHLSDRGLKYRVLNVRKESVNKLEDILTAADVRWNEDDV